MRSHGADSGATLLELLVAMVLVAVAGTLGMTAVGNYARQAAHQGNADLLVSDLRKTAQKSVSEGRTYCVLVDANARTYTVMRPGCGGPGAVSIEGPTRLEGRTRFGTLSGAGVSTGCPTGACVFFRPRGTATQASVELRQQGSPSITVTVEGLTGRVDRT